MTKFKKIPNRSDAYQNLLLDIPYPHELLDVFSSTDSIYKRLNPFSYNDEIAELEEQLTKELWRIIEDNLTARQKEVVKLYASGKTQVEIAKQLGVNQSSIVKCLAPETLIRFSAGSISIHDIWVDCHLHNHTSLFEQPLLCFNEDTKNSLTTTTIKSVVRNEIKPLISIITSSGKSIRATADHQFYTPQGWLELEEILTQNEKLTVYSPYGIVYEHIVNYWSGDKDFTYDIEVAPPFHNFIANNIIVHNCINGNVDYKNKDKKGKPIMYGGVRAKLRKIAKEDKRLNEILQQIAELRESDPF